ncbi:metallophosphoesterase [Evansella tamaricis]|nr:metallophosphoesterase [Evansella tamaricis]
MSDSHGWTTEVQQLVKRYENEVDVIIHCGDSELDYHSLELKNIILVRGNCDFGNGFPEEVVKDVKGVRFYVTHGHLLNVKMTEMNLIYKAEETGANVVCFGHTHVPIALQEKRTIIVNPGSMRLPRRVSVGTYVILEDDENKIDVTFYSLAGEKQQELSKTFFK